MSSYTLYKYFIVRDKLMKEITFEESLKYQFNHVFRVSNLKTIKLIEKNNLESLINDFKQLKSNNIFSQSPCVAGISVLQDKTTTTTTTVKKKKKKKIIKYYPIYKNKR